MPEEDEIKLGRQWHPEVLKQYKAYNDNALQGYVQRVGEQLAAKSPRDDLVFRFIVIDSNDVNAFSLPGGYIYITRGLLAYLNSEAELAAVLGHEIGHVTARHGVRQINVERGANSPAQAGVGAVFTPQLRDQARQNLVALLGKAVVSGYGADRELEADRLGADYLAASGYNPQAIIEVIGVLKNQQEFEIKRSKEEGTPPRVYHAMFAHPENDAALKGIVSAASKKRRDPGQRLNREDFFMTLDGLAFGDSEQQGVRRGNRFYHKELGIAVTFPSDWSLENISDRVVAFPSSESAVLQMTAVDLTPQIPPRDYMIKILKLDPTDGSKLSTPGLEGYTARAKSSTHFGIRESRFGVVYFQERALILMGSAKDKLTPQLDKLFLQTINSIHALSDPEQKLAEGLKIRVIGNDKAQRLMDLAAKSRLPVHAEEQLRLLNDLYPIGEPLPGQRLKVVE